MLAVAALTASGVSTAAESTDGWQPLDEIAATAEAFVVDELSNGDARLRPRAGSLDPRLRLARCEQPLEAFVADGATLSSRTTVGVRCTGVKPWKIYVPIQVAIMDTVMTAGRTLPRGHVLAAGDLAAEEKDVSRLAAGYMTSPERLIGRRLKQQLVVGRPITPSVLEDDIIIKRGQSVTITAQSRGLRIAMGGTALTDGSLNERIRVRNDQSKRVIEAIVRSEEYVEVLVD